MTVREFIELIRDSYELDEQVVGRVVGKADAQEIHSSKISEDEWVSVADLFEQALDDSVIADLEDALEGVLGV